MKRLKQVAVLVIVSFAAIATPAVAEVLDAPYRGTLVCDHLPFTNVSLREAIEVTISGGEVRYREVVRLGKTKTAAEPEQGTGTLAGQHIELQGSWKNGDRRYEAKYAGDFVRRSAQLKGTQTWTVGGTTVTRTCGGAIKRPFKPFLPRKKMTSAG
jgi:hypothetical protein